MNMGSWRLSRQEIGRNRWWERQWERQVHGWCRLCPPWPSYSCSLEKMAWCAVFALMVGYGHQGKWWRRQRQWGREWLWQKCWHLEWLHCLKIKVVTECCHSYYWFLILSVMFFDSVNAFEFNEASTSNVFFSNKNKN